MLNITGDLLLIIDLSELIKIISHVIMMGNDNPSDLVGTIASVEVGLLQFKQKFNLEEKVNARIKELLS